MFRFTMLALALMASGLLFAQTEMRGDLKRRAHLGVQMAAGAQGERVVQGLTAGAAAEKGGVEVGDVVLEVQGVSLGDAAAFSRMMAGLRAGDSARMKVRRGEEEKELTLTMGPRPTESAEDFGIVYDVVEHGEARLRSIATRPSAKGRYPAVFFIQGLTAASTEFYPGRSNTVQELLYGLTRRGFVTFRCEKSGCGDSTGEAASEVGFDFETEGFRKALAKLKTYDFVDPDRVYIFGHSMGGVMAPLVAPKKEVAGIVVYGTGLRPWNEYMVTNSRRQMKLSGVKASMADEMLRAHEKIHHLTLVEKWSLEKLRKERPELKAPLASMYTDGTHYGTRCLKFFQELQDVNLPRAWESVGSPVLAIHGEYDWVCCEDDHRGIAEIVSTEAEGRGRFLSLPGTFHGFDQHASLEASVKAPFRGPFNQRLLDEVVGFCTPARD